MTLDPSRNNKPFLTSYVVGISASQSLGCGAVSVEQLKGSSPCNTNVISRKSYRGECVPQCDLFLACLSAPSPPHTHTHAHTHTHTHTHTHKHTLTHSVGEKRHREGATVDNILSAEATSKTSFEGRKRLQECDGERC